MHRTGIASALPPQALKTQLGPALLAAVAQDAALLSATPVRTLLPPAPTACSAQQHPAQDEIQSCLFPIVLPLLPSLPNLPSVLACPLPAGQDLFAALNMTAVGPQVAMFIDSAQQLLAPITAAAGPPGSPPALDADTVSALQALLTAIADTSAVVATMPPPPPPKGSASSNGAAGARMSAAWLLGAAGTVAALHLL